MIVCLQFEVQDLQFEVQAKVQLGFDPSKLRTSTFYLQQTSHKVNTGQPRSVHRNLEVFTSQFAAVSSFNGHISSV
jgi:hypothetical protein